MNTVMVKSPRAILHAARLADAALFWPALAYVLWGQLQPDLPQILEGINDKLLHFSAYFVLGAMAGGAVRRPGAVKWAVLGLIVVGAVIEFIQGYVGRETSVLDGVANGTGAIAGALLARFILDPLRRRWGYDTGTRSDG
jgi:VanZ family protein